MLVLFAVFEIVVAVVAGMAVVGAVSLLMSWSWSLWVLLMASFARAALLATLEGRGSKRRGNSRESDDANDDVVDVVVDAAAATAAAGGLRPDWVAPAYGEAAPAAATAWSLWLPSPLAAVEEGGGTGTQGEALDAALEPHSARCDCIIISSSSSSSKDVEERRFCVW